MDHQQIFPTNIFLVDDFIPMITPTEKSDVAGMKKYISDKFKYMDIEEIIFSENRFEI